MSVLFILQPKDTKTLEYAFKNNQAICPNGRLIVTEETKSMFPGFLLRFGRCPHTNDFILPQDRAFDSNHFSFFFADSGELILKDHTTNNGCGIKVSHLDESEQSLYRISGHRPRQRVIPRISNTFTIYCGTKENSLKFRLDWYPGTNQDVLARHARLLADPYNPHTVPDFQDPDPSNKTITAANSASILQNAGLRSVYAPTLTFVVSSGAVKPRADQRKEIHKYYKLGSGTFGDIWKVVDMATGDVWAMKEPRKEAAYHDARESFKNEVETIAKLGHSNIAEFESIQGFTIGGPFQIFYKLYCGNVGDLISNHRMTHHHDCLGRPSSAPEWSGRFAKQLVSAMQYVVSQDLVHRDIKPRNILYDVDSSQEVYNFYLADFGLATSLSKPGVSQSGTHFFMAPELIARGIASQATDMWSFAITLGCVLGYWCEDRCLQLGWADWSRKLMAMDVPEQSPSYIAETDSVMQCTGHEILGLHLSRTLRLSTPTHHRLLPQIFSLVIRAEERRLTFNQCLEIESIFFTDPRTAIEPKGWDIAAAYSPALFWKRGSVWVC